jgi:hypothetical protein
MKARVKEEMAKELARKTLEKEQELILLQLQVKTAEQVKRTEELREQQAAHDRQLILTKANAATLPAPAGNTTPSNAAAGAHMHGVECVHEPSRSSILGERPWHNPHVSVQERLDYPGSGGRGRRVWGGGKTGRLSGSGIQSRDGRDERGREDEGVGEGVIYVDIDPEHVPLLLDDLLLDRDVEEGSEEEEEETETWQQRRAQRAQEEKKKLKVLLACYHKALLNMMLYYAKAQRAREVCESVCVCGPIYIYTYIFTHTHRLGAPAVPWMLQCRC